MYYRLFFLERASKRRRRSSGRTHYHQSEDKVLMRASTHPHTYSRTHQQLRKSQMRSTLANINGGINHEIRTRRNSQTATAGIHQANREKTPSNRVVATAAPKRTKKKEKKKKKFVGFVYCHCDMQRTQRNERQRSGCGCVLCCVCVRESMR